MPHDRDWTTFDDMEKLQTAVLSQGPSSHPHALFLQDPPIMCSSLWLWFASAEERALWVHRMMVLKGRDDADEALDRLRAAGEGPASEGLDAFVGDSEVAWVGTFDELREGADPFAVQIREGFWEVQDEDDDAGARPIPDELVDEFFEMSFLPT